MNNFFYHDGKAYTEKEFREKVNEAYKKGKSQAKFNYQAGGTGRGKTQAAQDWINAHTDTFDPGPGRVEVLELVHHGEWTAPIGWNNYLKTGNFIGCKPIIKPGAKFNTRASFIDPINFEMV